MSDFSNKLRELGVEDDSFVWLSYSEGCDVWHINESHVQESVAETDTASMLAGLLASGVPIYGTYGSAEPGCDILSEMRDNDLLEDYDYEGWFGEYLTEKLQETIYDGEYSVEYSTTQYDYKRGRCDISTEVRVRVGDLYEAEGSAQFRFQGFDAGSLVGGFDVAVATKHGPLTLN